MGMLPGTGSARPLRATSALHWRDGSLWERIELLRRFQGSASFQILVEVRGASELGKRTLWVDTHAWCVRAAWFRMVHYVPLEDRRTTIAVFSGLGILCRLKPRSSVTINP